MTTHRASCHCGRIAFTFGGDIGPVLSCNCSICTRRGSLLHFVPRKDVTFETPIENATAYTFNKERIEHRFCPVCGILPFALADAPDGTPTVAINVRCVEGIQLDKLTVQHFDGRKL